MTYLSNSLVYYGHCLLKMDNGNPRRKLNNKDLLVILYQLSIHANACLCPTSSTSRIAFWIYSSIRLWSPQRSNLTSTLKSILSQLFTKEIDRYPFTMIVNSPVCKSTSQDLLFQANLNLKGHDQFLWTWILSNLLLLCNDDRQPCHWRYCNKTRCSVIFTFH